MVEAANQGALILTCADIAFIGERKTNVAVVPSRVSGSMRVALIPSWFPTEEKPLFGSFVMDQARALCASDESLELHVFAPDATPRWLSPSSPLAASKTFLASYSADVPSERDPICSNLTVHRVPTVHAHGRFGVDGSTPYRIIVQRAMKRVERERGPFDLVHAHVCYPAGVICANLRPRRPWILTEHQGPFPFPDLVSSPSGAWRRAQQAFKSASAVVAVSRMQAGEIERSTEVQPVVIPNVCDERMFYPREDRPSGPFRFLTVAGLVEGKGVDILLDAIARFTARGGNALFTIVGAGPLETQLRDQCTALGLDEVVEWRGTVQREALPHVFREADAFVLPSLHESFGVVFIEALASGIPVIATRCGGPEEFVTEDNGLLIPVGEVESLASAMEQLVGRSFDSSQIRDGFLRRFSGAVVGPRIRDLYEEVLKRAAA